MNKGNSTITVLVAVVLALVVALGVSFLGATKGDKGDRGEPGLTVQGPKGEKGEVDVSVLRSLQSALQNLSNVVAKLPPPKLGATPGDDHYGAYWGVNDVRHYTYSQPFSAASTTICSFRTPNATTTLIRAIANMRTGTSTASEFEWGKSTVMDATTTSLGRTLAFTASAAGSFQASTTALNNNSLTVGLSADDTSIIAPLSYINFKIGNTPCSSGATTCNATVGVCKFELGDLSL